MIKSMTGYGKSVSETMQRKVTVEIKSLNSKQLDLNTKLPWLYKEKELEIRNLVSQNLERGKIDLSVNLENNDAENLPSINKAVFASYYRQLSEIAGELDMVLKDNVIPAIMRMPETLRSDKSEISESEWEQAKGQILAAIGELDAYRIEEGKALGKDMRSNIDRILKHLGDIENFEEERIVKVREKLHQLLDRSAATEAVDRNRFEQEIIYYLEKYDFNEEKVRLRKHCDYFLETLDTPAPNGKILGFITQEIGREINTIGSKANHASIQKLVVKMKDDLEKIREQALNVL